MGFSMLREDREVGGELGLEAGEGSEHDQTTLYGNLESIKLIKSWVISVT